MIKMATLGLCWSISVCMTQLAFKLEEHGFFSDNPLLLGHHLVFHQTWILKRKVFLGS